MGLTEGWLKAELHTHTSDDPIDGGRMVTHSSRELIDAASEKGYDVLSITNHDQLLYNDELKVYAESRGILLIPGVEATIDRKHLLLYNFLDYQPGWDKFEGVASRKGEGQLIIAPHPFYPISTAVKKEIYNWTPILDAVEYSGFYWHWPNFNRQGRKIARELDLPLVGSTDLHFLFQLGLTYCLIHSQKEVLAVVRSIRAGRLRLVTRPTPLLSIAKWQYVAMREKLLSLFSSSTRSANDEECEQ